MKEIEGKGRRGLWICKERRETMKGVIDGTRTTGSVDCGVQDLTKLRIT
jgi:hypothetical protein